MKKLMVIMTLCSIVLFGADMQVVGSGTKVLASPEMTNSLNMLKKSKQIKFKEQEPAQITLNVSVDVDPLEVSAMTEEERQAIVGVLIFCNVYQKEDVDPNYATELPLKSGQNKLQVKFNGIPHRELLDINAYRCALYYKGTEGGYTFIPNRTGKYYSKLISEQEGSIEW